jgi:hypothetical protein
LTQIAGLIPRKLGRLPEEASQVLQEAAWLGVPIEYLGTHPAFDEIRVYRGDGRDWVLAPLHLDRVFQDGGGALPIPAANLETLWRLVDGGVDFPAVYIAHDIPAGAIEALEAASTAATTMSLVPSRGPFVISPDLARQVVPAVPPPERTLEWSRRYGLACDVTLKALAVVATAAIGVAVAPLFVVPSIFQGLLYTDPVLFGAMPLEICLGEEAPVGWFLITSWSY